MIFTKWMWKTLGKDRYMNHYLNPHPLFHWLIPWVKLTWMWKIHHFYVDHFPRGKPLVQSVSEGVCGNGGSTEAWEGGWFFFDMIWPAKCHRVWFGGHRWLIISDDTLTKSHYGFSQSMESSQLVEFKKRRFWTLLNWMFTNKNGWLVVWNIWIIFPYIGNNHPNWLSYFSEGLKPPTRWECIASPKWFFPSTFRCPEYDYPGPCTLVRVANVTHVFVSK